MNRSKRFFTATMVVLALVAAQALPAFAAKAHAGNMQGAHAQGPMYGKTVLIVGDSIQAARNYKKYGAFIQQACETLGAEAIANKAIGGATLANVYNDSKTSAYQQVMQEHYYKTLGKYDYYFIAAGTNDYGGIHGKGKADSGDKSSKEIDTSCGALNKMIKTIYTDHKRATGKKPLIFVVSPIGRTAKTDRHSREDDPNKTFGKGLAEYRKGINQTASKYKYVVSVNGLKLATTEEMALKANSKDGLHPKASFAKNTIAKRLAKIIKRHIG